MQARCVARLLLPRGCERRRTRTRRSALQPAVCSELRRARSERRTDATHRLTGPRVDKTNMEAPSLLCDSTAWQVVQSDTEDVDVPASPAQRLALLRRLLKEVPTLLRSLARPDAWLELQAPLDDALASLGRVLEALDAPPAKHDEKATTADAPVTVARATQRRELAEAAGTARFSAQRF